MTNPLEQLIQSMIGGFGPFVPRLLAAVVILVVTWIIASVVRGALQKLGRGARLDARMDNPGMTSTFSDLGYWLVWLVSLPMLLGALQLEGLLTPVNNLVSGLLGFLPNLLSAALIFGIGFLVARIVQKIVVGLLTAAGSENFASRVGLSQSLGNGGLAGLVGSIVLLLILLPVTAAGLQPLGLESVTKPVSGMLDSVLALVPKLAAAAVIVVVAVVLGRILAGIVTAMLAGAGADKLPKAMGLGEGFKIANRNLSEVLGFVVLATVVVAAVTQASQVLGLEVLQNGIAQLGGILARVFAGVVVLAVAMWLANFLAGLVRTSSVANAALLATITRVAVLFLAVPMALSQMGLPNEIITIGFGGLVASASVAAAIAFGFGGRDQAARVLEDVSGRKAVGRS